MFARSRSVGNPACAPSSAVSPWICVPCEYGWPSCTASATLRGVWLAMRRLKMSKLAVGLAPQETSLEALSSKLFPHPITPLHDTTTPHTRASRRMEPKCDASLQVPASTRPPCTSESARTDEMNCLANMEVLRRRLFPAASRGAGSTGFANTDQRQRLRQTKSIGESALFSRAS